MKGFQKRYLRSLGHNLKPVVVIGRNGLSPAVMAKVDQELNAHELIKIRFSDFKEERKQLVEQIAEATQSATAGVLGNTAILYREHADPDKRSIVVPQRESGGEKA